MRKPDNFSPEVRERAVRIVQRKRDQNPSRWTAVESIALKIGCVPQTLLNRVKQSDVDGGARRGTTTAEQDRIKEIEPEVKELRPANEILKMASDYFDSGGTRPPLEVMVAFTVAYRGRFGVTSICKALLPRRVLGVRLLVAGYRRFARQGTSVTVRRFPRSNAARRAT